MYLIVRCVSYFMLCVLFVVCMPLSWFLAYELDGLIGLLLSLGMPTLGLALSLVYYFFGHGFWQFILAWVLSIIGGYISFFLFSVLQEFTKKNPHIIQHKEYQKEIRACSKWLGQTYDKIRPRLKKVLSLKNVKEFDKDHNLSPRIVVLKCIASIVREEFLYSGEIYGKPTPQGRSLLSSYRDTLERLVEAGEITEKDKSEASSDIMSEFKSMYRG